jgi:hypothetical protein
VASCSLTPRFPSPQGLAGRPQRKEGRRTFNDENDPYKLLSKRAGFCSPFHKNERRNYQHVFCFDQNVLHVAQNLFHVAQHVLHVERNFLRFDENFFNVHQKFLSVEQNFFHVDEKFFHVH